MREPDLVIAREECGNEDGVKGGIWPWRAAVYRLVTEQR